MPTDSRGRVAAESSTCRLTKDGATRILREGKVVHDAHGHPGHAAGVASGVDRARYDPATLATSAGTYGRGNGRWSNDVGT